MVLVDTTVAHIRGYISIFLYRPFGFCVQWQYLARNTRSAYVDQTYGVCVTVVHRSFCSVCVCAIMLSCVVCGCRRLVCVFSPDAMCRRGTRRLPFDIVFAFDIVFTSAIAAFWPSNDTARVVFHVMYLMRYRVAYQRHTHTHTHTS
jgi:hypothetical protein